MIALSQVRPDSRELLEKATYYEDLATGTLRCVRQSAMAYALLSVIPWELATNGSGEKRIAPLWASSVLEEASTADHILSFPCRTFIGHRHSQETLARYFAGNYPNSSAQIAPEAGLFAILLQCFMPFLPGTIVEVSPGSLVNERVLSGPLVTEKFKNGTSADDQAIGADEQQALQEMREALETAETEATEKDTSLRERGLKAFFDEEMADLADDLTSFRFLAFYGIPKVKFALDFFFYIVYVVQNTFIAINLRQVDATCVNALGEPCTNEDVGYTTVASISVNEYLFWFWCLAKAVGEVDNIKSFDKVGLAEYATALHQTASSIATPRLCYRCALPHASLMPFLQVHRRYVEPTGHSLLLDHGSHRPLADLVQQLSRATHTGRGRHRHAHAHGAAGRLVLTPAGLELLPHPPLPLVLQVHWRACARRQLHDGTQRTPWLRTPLVVLRNMLLLPTHAIPPQGDVAVFATLLFLITIGFGFAFFTLLPTRVAAAPGAEFFLGSHPLWDSWWGLFGDYDRGTIYEQGV